jgi:ABC-2 type transport system permease protein
MRQLLTIAWNDLRLAFQERSIWLDLIVIPIVITVAVGFANGGAQQQPAAATEPDPVSQAAADYAGRVASALVERLPEGVALSAEQQAAVVQNARDAALTQFAAGPITLQVESRVNAAQSEPTARSGGGGFTQSVPGMATMYVMFVIFPAMALFIRDRRQWITQRLLTLPLSRMQILGGRLTARFVLGMLQYLILFAFGLIVLQVSFGGEPVALLALMVAFTVCITGFMTLIATIPQNEGQARGISLFLSLTLAPLGGAWWPLDIVPPFMQTIGNLTPVGWVMNGFSSVIYLNGTLITILPNVALLVAFGLICFALGTRRLQFT